MDGEEEASKENQFLFLRWPSRNLKVGADHNTQKNPPVAPAGLLLYSLYEGCLV